MFDREALKETIFSWESAHALAMASQLAYQDKPAILKHVVTVTWGFDDCQIFSEGETQGFIAWDSDVVVICFRGTESVGDWLANLNIFRESRSYGSVHKGFLQAYQAVEGQIKSILDSASPGGKTVWSTGHSLGGALATVAGVSFERSPLVAGCSAQASIAWGPGGASGKGPYASDVGGRHAIRSVRDRDPRGAVTVGGRGRTGAGGYRRPVHVGHPGRADRRLRSGRSSARASRQAGTG